MTTLSDDGSVTATLLFCVSAAGEKMPPFYLFQGKYVVDGLLQGAPPDSLIGVSENGWMDSDHFFAWLTRFVAHIDKTRKDARALLVVDGHRSRIQLVAAEYAKQHNVDLLIFPSHTTHLLQPLDVACFKPFKDRYRQEIKLHYSTGKGFLNKLESFSLDCLSASFPQFPFARFRYHIAKLTAPAWDAVKLDTIVNGFRKAGVYPLNREEVLGRLPANSTTKKKTITTSQKATPEDRIQRLEKELIFFKVQLSAYQEREKEKEPEPKKRRIQTEAIVLSQEEVITELARVDKEKREKVELAKQKKEELEQKRVAAAEAKALKKEQLRLAKAENFSLKGENLGETVTDPAKFHQRNVETFLNQLRQLGDLEDMPPVTA